MSRRDETETETENRVIHEVDGIQEYDNKLPNWWLLSFYGAIMFAVGYWYHYHVGGFGDLPAAAYQAELDRAAAADADRVKREGVMTPEALATLSRDKTTVAQGLQVFSTTCAACHRADGGGNVGPNLTDDFWLHGGAPDQIYKTITEGVPAKGMPPWGPMLGPAKVQAVTAYVLTLRGTNVPAGKPPQGERNSLSLR
jgi:cytochrome c oxidase cbb3-type subunit 3